ncbi:MAG: TMEM165/GDT1 family protein [Acidimicrobiales bacterium]
MDLAVIATVYIVIVVAELPDKSMIATLVMGSRSSPLFVWIGASAAFLIHVVLAVVAGKLLLLLPHTVLQIIVATLFVGGALYLILVPEREVLAEGEAAAGAQVPAEGETAAAKRLEVAGTAFGVVLVGELGDITQLLTINLVAKYHAPLEVGIGAALAFVTDAALGAFAGRALLRLLPISTIRVAGGLIFLGFAAVTLYTLVAR